MPDTSVRWPLWLSFVLWSGFICYGLLTSSNDLPRFTWLQFEGADKLIHIGLFGVDGFLLALAASPLGNTKVLTGAIAWCLVFGGALELAQHYLITDRTGDVLDLVADTIGGLLGSLGLGAIPKKFRA